MIGTVIKAELRNMRRDRMYLFFAIYPVILGGIGYFLVPYIEDNTPPGDPWAKILAMFFILMTGYIYGALTAFTLLDDKDDSVLMSLKITPISVKSYVIVKLVVSFIFGFIASLAVIYGTGFLENTSFGIILLVAITGALQAPGVALIVNSFAENKVEGFVIMKLSGLILILPVVAFFVTGWVQNLLGIAPGYWAARIIELELVPSEEGSAVLTFFGGVAYNMVFLWLLMKLYVKRSNI
jgi:fluoroquinolone transport system permease protein